MEESSKETELRKKFDAKVAHAIENKFKMRLNVFPKHYPILKAASEAIVDNFELIVRPAIGPAAVNRKTVSPIMVPPGTLWENITIKFINGNDVAVSVKGMKKTIRSDFKAMGFENLRNNAPDVQWEMLRYLSEHNGTIQHAPIRTDNFKATAMFGSSNGEYDDVKSGYSMHPVPNVYRTRKKLLSAGLKRFFGIADEPFRPYDNETGYQIRIQLIPIGKSFRQEHSE